MSEPIVMHALRAKRAELSGELRAAEKRIEQLTAALGHVDATMRLFDPTCAPETIRPKLKRATPARFRRGEFSAAILGVLRDTPEPLAARQVAQQVAERLKLDAAPGEALNDLLARVRNVLAQHKGGALVCEVQPDKTGLWRVA